MNKVTLGVVGVVVVAALVAFLTVGQQEPLPVHETVVEQKTEEVSLQPVEPTSSEVVTESVSSGSGSGSAEEVTQPVAPASH
jgi:hypothetical protein